MLGRVRAYLCFSKTHPGPGARMQWMTVHNGLFQVDERIGIARGAGQGRWPAVGGGLSRPGQGQVGDAVVDLVGQPCRVRA